MFEEWISLWVMEGSDKAGPLEIGEERYCRGLPAIALKPDAHMVITWLKAASTLVRKNGACKF